MFSDFLLGWFCTVYMKWFIFSVFLSVDWGHPFGRRLCFLWKCSYAWGNGLAEICRCGPETKTLCHFQWRWQSKYVVELSKAWTLPTTNDQCSRACVYFVCVLQTSMGWLTLQIWSFWKMLPLAVACRSSLNYFVQLRYMYGILPIPLSRVTCMYLIYATEQLRAQ